MESALIPVVSLPHFIGATATLSLTLICLIIYILFKGYRLLGALAVLYGALTLHLAGLAGWASQPSLPWLIGFYRLTLIGLVWIPVGWVLVLSAIAEVSYRRLVYGLASLSFILTLLCALGSHPWLLSETLISPGQLGLLRPASLFLRNFVAIYPLLVGLSFTFFLLIQTRLRGDGPAGESPAFVPALLALAGYIAGGVHDVYGAIFDSFPLFPGPVQWLAALWLAFWLALAVMIRFKETEKSMIRRTEDLIIIRTGSMLGACSAQVAGRVNEYVSKFSASLAILREEHLSAGAAQTLATLSRGAENLSRFTLRLSLLADRPHLDFRDERLDRRLEAILAGLENLIRAKEVNISLSGSLALSLKADWNLLDRVLEILLTNSLEAVSRQGRIEIRVDCSTMGLAAIEIIDDGPGPTRAQLGALAQPLLSPVDETTGMNLLMIRNIAEAHSGQVDLENGPGGGTRARILLPIKPPLGRMAEHGNFSNTGG